MFKRTLTLTRTTFFFTLAALVASCDDAEPGKTPIITSFTADPMTIAPGTMSTLRWETTDAQSVRIDIQGGGANVLPASPIPMGSVATPILNESTTFVLTATNGELTSTKVVTVMVRGGPGSATITSFTATPMAVDLGESSTLAWRTTNATRGVIRIGANNIIHTIPAAMLNEGTFEVTSVNEPTMFTLSVSGEDNMEVTADVLVTLTGPVVVSFLAMPNTIVRGESTSLVYSVRNATRVVISGSVSGEVHRSSSLMDQVTVSPTMTETFTITATDDGGAMATDTEIVTVNDPNAARIASFLASPSAVDAGAPVLLSWEVSNAPGGVEISAGGNTLHTSMDDVGTFIVMPNATTEYTLKALNAVDGDSTARATVTVGTLVPDIVDFDVRPNPGRLGGTAIFSWVVQDADQIRVLAGARELLDVPAANDPGQVAIDLTETATTVTLEVSNAVGGNTASVRVYAHNPPVINSFTATPQTFTGMSADVTISWDVSSVAELELLANGAPAPGFTVIREFHTRDASGTIMLQANGPLVLELIAKSGGGVLRETRIVSPLVAELEPNDTPATAQPIPGDGTAIDANFDRMGDEDYYAITVPAGGNVYAQTSDGMGGCARDTILELIAPDGTTIVTENDDYGLSTCSLIDPRIDPLARDLPAGTYYIRVEEFDDSTGAYVLVVVVGAAECGNGFIELNAATSESCDDGNAFSGDGCSMTCQGEAMRAFVGPPLMDSALDAISLPGQLDFYRIEMTAEGYIGAETFAPISGECRDDTLMRLYDSSFNLIAQDDDDGFALCSRFDPRADAFARVMPGTYFLSVGEQSGLLQIGAYVLEINLIGIGCGNGIVESGETCDDGNTASNDGCSNTCSIEGMFENEAGGNNTPMGAGVVVIDADGSWVASIDPIGDQDYYAIDVPNQFHLDVRVTVGSLTDCAIDQPRAELSMFGTDGVTLLANNNNAGPNGTCGRLWPYTSLATYDMQGGRYYIRVRELNDDALIPQYYLHVRLIDRGCGNTVIDLSEQCDDGNTVSGDGCSSTCRFEPIGFFNAPGGPEVFPGSISPAGDIDVFQIDVTSDVYLRAATFAPSAMSGLCTAPTDTVITLYDASFTMTLASDDDDGEGNCAEISFRDTVRLLPGTYFILVQDYEHNSAIPTYELLLDAPLADVCGNSVVDGAETCDDGNTAPNDGCDATCQFELHPTMVNPPGATATFNLSSPGAFAIFAVNMTMDGQSIFATTSDPSSATCNNVDTAIELLDVNFTPVGLRSGGGAVGAAGVCATLENPRDRFATDLFGAPYFLKVINEGTTTGMVEVSIGIRDPACPNGITERNAFESCDDGNMVDGDGCSSTCVTEATAETEPNDTIATADDIGLANVGTRTGEGTVNRMGAGDSDYWRFVVPSGPPRAVIATTYSFAGLPSQCNNMTTDTEIQLEDSMGMALEINDNRQAGVNSCSLIDGTDPSTFPGAEALSPGTYYLRVRQSPFAPPASSPYFLDIELL